MNEKEMLAAMVVGSLLGEERAQFLLPPACEKGKVVCSFRKHQKREMSFDDYENNGSFDDERSRINRLAENSRFFNTVINSVFEA